MTLLVVDPASACRLLGSRRCCNCCCCPAPTCDSGLPATIDEPAGDQPPDNQPMQPSPSDRNVPPAPDAEPTAIVPPAASFAPAIPADSDDARPVETLATQPTPANDVLLPKPSTPTTASAPATSAPSAPQPMSIEPGRPASVTPADAVPSIPNTSAPPTPRTSPAPSATPRPATPVAPPAFPPADDDPFAPAPTSGAKKRANTAPAVERTPVDDDPFAPLPSSPPATTSRPKAAAPTALAREDNLTDPLRLGADGRLFVREWTDSSGAFRVKGRLVLILDGKVRLLKETGRTTTVPVERLSAGDRAYVAEVIARYGTDLEQLDQLAAR